MTLSIGDNARGDGWDVRDRLDVLDGRVGGMDIFSGNV